MGLQLHHFESSSAAAQALATQIAGDLQHALLHNLRALLLVSGGRSPLPLFSALSTQPLAWSQIDISLVDERSVPSTHADANAALVRQHLLINAAAAARMLPLVADDVISAAHDLWSAAGDAADAANRSTKLTKPVVVVLGIGTDGHTASLFADAPQWPLAQSTPSRYLALQPTHAPHARVSLSLSALRAQHQCYVWAVGSDKLATIERCRSLPTSSCALAALINTPDMMLDVFYSDA